MEATEEEEEESNSNNGEQATIFHDAHLMSELDIDSSCSTPYVSAPSSPGRVPTSPPSFRFFYSAPSSPMHFLLSSSPNSPSYSSVSASSDFEFSARFSAAGSSSAGSMTSADELFLDGKIRPMRQVLEPLLENEMIDSEDGEVLKETRGRERDLKIRDRSVRRRARSLSPLRTTSSIEWYAAEEESAEADPRSGLSSESGVEIRKESEADETAPSESAPASRSKRWVFLKDFLYRSKSEGRNNGHKFWSSISFSPGKDRKLSSTSDSMSAAITDDTASKKGKQSGKGTNKKAANGVGKKRVTVQPSAHELHYTAKRAQAEEMRKKTYLPYRQGLLGCLGFSSRSYGAMNGFARALNPVSSR